MIKSFRIRLFPTPEQEKLMVSSSNAARFAYNWALAQNLNRNKNKEKYLSEGSLRKEFTKFRKETPWLQTVSSKVPAMAIKDYGIALDRFFKNLKSGEPVFTNKVKLKAARQKRSLTEYDKNGYPRFKKKKDSIFSFYVTEDNLYFLNGNIAVLEVIGKVKFKTNYNLPCVESKKFNTSKFINPRISRKPNGKWILSFGMRVDENQITPHNNYSVGIDLGVKDLAVISYDNSTKYKKFSNINKTNKVNKLHRKVKHLQRKLSRKRYDSSNYVKLKHKLRLLQFRISNINKDYRYKVISEIIKLNPSIIKMEDLNVSGMMKNKRLARAIQQQSFYDFTRIIEYKCLWNNIQFFKVPRFYPSSKICSACGNKKEKLSLRERIYECSVCGFVEDRDINAAINLECYQQI